MSLFTANDEQDMKHVVKEVEGVIAYDMNNQLTRLIENEEIK